MSAPDIITSVWFPPAGQKATSLTVQWTPPEPTETYGAATSYEIGISQDVPDANPITLPASVTKYTFKGLFPNTFYRVAIRAVNDDGTSEEWTMTSWTTKADLEPRPRFAEFIRLKTITNRYLDWMIVDGNDFFDNEFYDGGNVNG